MNLGRGRREENGAAIASAISCLGRKRESGLCSASFSSLLPQSGEVVRRHLLGAPTALRVGFNAIASSGLSFSSFFLLPCSYPSALVKREKLKSLAALVQQRRWRLPACQLASCLSRVSSPLPSRSPSSLLRASLSPS